MYCPAGRSRGPFRYVPSALQGEALLTMEVGDGASKDGVNLSGKQPGMI